MRPGYVDATGTRRRLEALAALGWSARHIGLAMGRPAASSRALVCTWKHRGRRVIDARTAAQVASVYEQLRQSPGSNSVVRINALRTGFREPGAWAGVDIDDPEARASTDDEDEERAVA